MPMRPPHACRPGCPNLVPATQRRCDECTAQTAKATDVRRGSRQSRGYGAAHDRNRKTWFATPLPALGRPPVLCGDRVTGMSSEHSSCRRDGRDVVGRVLDHVKPKEQGGADDPSNYQTLCDHDHNVKRQAESMAARGARR